MAVLELSIRHGWADVYETIRQSLIEAFGPVATGFHHIGSTSVTGLLSKPVVDVLVSVTEIPLPPIVRDATAALGFDYRGEFGVARREFLARRDCHVHAFLPGEGESIIHLLFRDFLRASADGRRTYASFKAETAQRVGWDRAAYQAAKDSYVTGFLSAAWEWADRTGWQPPPGFGRVALPSSRNVER